MNAAEYAEQVEYLFGKHIETHIALFGDGDAQEHHFTFFNALAVDEAGWEEFLEDTFDFYEFQEQLFQDEQWNFDKYMPLALEGVGSVWFDPNAGDDDYDGQVEGLLIAELSGNTVAECPVFMVYIDGTATYDEPSRLTVTLRELFDANQR